MGSASELEYEILLAKDLGFLSAGVQQALNTKIIEVKQMLASFLKKLKADS
jgi:four helix bundle protein